MSERVFRLVLGASLLLLLFLQNETLIHAFIGLLLFEGITNLRIPILVSKLRYGKSYNASQVSSPECRSIQIEAEQILRFVVAILLIVTYVLYPTQLWLIPWFVGFMLFMAGVTNICPMAMTLHWMGFK